MQFFTLVTAFFFLFVLSKVTFFFHKALGKSFLFSTGLFSADLQDLSTICNSPYRLFKSFHLLNRINLKLLSILKHEWDKENKATPF